MNNARQTWLKWMGEPTNYAFDHTLTFVKKYEKPEYDAEVYIQANGVGTAQRLIKAFPKNMTGPVPCVIVPYYFPEAMLGTDPETDEVLTDYMEVAMMLHLVRRGYAVASAEAFHLTYVTRGRDPETFRPWLDSANALLADHPNWTGISKLVRDTQLVIDVMADDPRVDASRIGIAGHSLGGVMSFYTGCLDERIKVILASDFGMDWDRTNWRDPWYWGAKVEQLKAAGLDHSSLLGAAAPKPMMLFAGKYDNDDSYKMMLAAPGYEGKEDRLGFINHATGHRPPADVQEKGYEFLDKWLK